MSSREQIDSLRRHLEQKVIGQEALTLRLLIALLADGHLLVEGPPGLAKTRAVKVLAELIEGEFHRIQFTPDLLPGDLTGTEIYRPEDHSFSFQPGPLFHNLLLADEVNRAPAKVQSALLEAMAERQITIGRETYHLPRLFMVMATQNPIEQEGTYPLPEAQLDRFLLKVHMGYPAREAERRIVELVHRELAAPAGPSERPAHIPQRVIFQARSEALQTHMADSVRDYLVELVRATRDPGLYRHELAQWIAFGASPRAGIALDLCSRALAWLQGRTFVSPEDVQAIAVDVLRHRLVLSFEAEASAVSADDYIGELLRRVPVP